MSSWVPLSGWKPWLERRKDRWREDRCELGIREGASGEGAGFVRGACRHLQSQTAGLRKQECWRQLSGKNALTGRKEAAGECASSTIQSGAAGGGTVVDLRPALGFDAVVQSRQRNKDGEYAHTNSAKRDRKAKGGRGVSE